MTQVKKNLKLGMKFNIDQILDSLGQKLTLSEILKMLETKRKTSGDRAFDWLQIMSELKTSKQ